MDLDKVFKCGASLPWEWLKLTPGEQLFELRSDLHLSQRHLAERAGVTHSVIARLEGGADARLSTWRRVFDALGYYAVLAPVVCGDEGAETLLQQRGERWLRQQNGLELGRLPYGRRRRA